MSLPASWSRRSVLAALGLASLVVGCGNDDSTNVVPPVNAFTDTRLVANVTGYGATYLNPSLANPWGLAFDPSGLWVANNGTGTSTAYNAGGIRIGTIAIPSTTTATGGVPTGVASNLTNDFPIGTSGASWLIFAGEDGTISAWNDAMTSAQVVVDRSANGAVYKGIALAQTGGVNFLYATDFRNGRVDVFNSSFELVAAFTDASLPAGFAPFGIQNIDGALYVTFAKQLAPDNKEDVSGAGNGYVDVFDGGGNLVRRFASTGNLNSPWAVAKAPAGFGGLGGAILIGNFGDGLIGAYDQTNGNFIDVLRDANGNPIVIDGLWGIAFVPLAGYTTLYYTAGPNDEADGILGALTP